MKNRYILLLLILSLLISCTEDDDTPISKELKISASLALDITEPSGVALNYEKTRLWIVGDQDSKIYLTDLKGDIKDEITLDKNDMEGIAIIGDSLIAVVVEESREVVVMTPEGKNKKTLQTGVTGETNNGFEGITFLPGENVLLIANEKNPEFILKMDLDGNKISQTTINFGKDVADLFYDSQRNSLWIISQESSTIYLCDLDFNIEKEYTIPSKDFEGICVDGNMIYLVSDSENMLYIYELTQ